MLEVIDKGSTTEAHPVPLLFVHGAWHAAWCWNEYFLDYFADRGYRAIAVSLRGHGESSVPESPRKVSFSDYVDDVAAVADALPRRPVVIGHSMGGSVVQKYLEMHEAPLGVLIASLPPSGNPGFLMRWAKKHPWHFTTIMLTGNSLRRLNTPELAREKLFSPYTAEREVVRHAARLEEEHSRTISVESPVVTRRSPNRVSTRLLVLGAECDGCITAKELRRHGPSTATQILGHYFAPDRWPRRCRDDDIRHTVVGRRVRPRWYR